MRHSHDGYVSSLSPAPVRQQAEQLLVFANLLQTVPVERHLGFSCFFGGKGGVIAEAVLGAAVALGFVEADALAEA